MRTFMPENDVIKFALKKKSVLVMVGKLYFLILSL